MSELARLISDYSSKNEHTSSPSRIFSIRSSPHDSSIKLIHPLGQSLDAPPLYSIIASKTAKSNIVVFRGEPHTSPPIAHATFSSWLSKAEISLHGQSMRLKQSSISGNFSLEYPSNSKLKWKANPLTGSGLELCDAAGVRIAKYKSAGFGGAGDRNLEVLVPWDERFLEVVLVSAVAARGLMGLQSEVAVEATGGVAGA